MKSGPCCRSNIEDCRPRDIPSVSCHLALQFAQRAPNFLGDVVFFKKVQSRSIPSPNGSPTFSLSPALAKIRPGVEPDSQRAPGRSSLAKLDMAASVSIRSMHPAAVMRSAVPARSSLAEMATSALPTLKRGEKVQKLWCQSSGYTRWRGPDVQSAQLWAKNKQTLGSPGSTLLVGSGKEDQMKKHSPAERGNHHPVLERSCEYELSISCLHFLRCHQYNCRSPLDPVSSLVKRKYPIVGSPLKVSM